VGKVVEVTVTAVHEREVEVRLADGRTGVVGRREFESAPVVGAVVPAALLARDDPKGRVALSHEWARKQLLWDAMDAAKADHTPLRGTLTSVVKGGAVVDLGLRAFLPASMVGEQPGADPQPLVGTEIDVMVLEVDRAKERLVVSRRDFLRRERRATERAAYSSLKAELTRMHAKTSWDRLAELFTLPPCGGQKGTELLAAMQRLKPDDPELWFRWQYFSRLPEWIQRQLAEDAGTVEQLAARYKKIEGLLAAKESETGQRDNIVRQFLDQAKQQIQRANSDAERKEAWGFLGDIEGQLKR
jgi:hypothetical protein